MICAPDVRAFLDEPNFGVLATTNADGTTQQTLMWYALIGDEIVMNTASGRRKHVNIDQRPTASICVVKGRQYVTVAGTARAEPDDPGLHRQIGRRYVDNEEMERLFSTAYDQQDRITIRMTVDSILDGRNV